MKRSSVLNIGGFVFAFTFMNLCVCACVWICGHFCVQCRIYACEAGGEVNRTWRKYFLVFRSNKQWYTNHRHTVPALTHTQNTCSILTVQCSHISEQLSHTHICFLHVEAISDIHAVSISLNQPFSDMKILSGTDYLV